MSEHSTKRTPKTTKIYDEYMTSAKPKGKKVKSTIRKFNLKRLHLRNEMNLETGKIGKKSICKIYGGVILSHLAILREKPDEVKTKERKQKN